MIFIIIFIIALILLITLFVYQSFILKKNRENLDYKKNTHDTEGEKIILIAKKISISIKKIFKKFITLLTNKILFSYKSIKKYSIKIRKKIRSYFFNVKKEEIKEESSFIREIKKTQK